MKSSTIQTTIQSNVKEIQLVEVSAIITFGWFLLAVFYPVFYILNGVAFSRLAKVAGRSDIAWIAWIPVLSAVQKLLILRKSGWLVLVYLIPGFNIAYAIIWHDQLLRAFGKNGDYVLFGVFLLPIYRIMWFTWGMAPDTRYSWPIERTTSGAYTTA